MSTQGPALTARDIILSLGLPDGCRVDQRVPRKLLLENGAPTAAGKRLINDGIEEIQWVAALKPNTIGVSEYRDDVREYVEIAVLTVTLRVTDDKPAKVARLTELVHRAVPYPVLLLLHSGQRVMLSLAHKRWAQNEAGKVVLDGEITQIDLAETPAPLVIQALLDALALATQPRAHLLALYQGWMDTLIAYLVACKTGAFSRAVSPEHSAECRQSLRESQELEAQLINLRAIASKERQLARQVELNLKIKRVQADIAAIQEQLTKGTSP